jgi:NAD(P)-dependent dehydrogenase (short-subunit alcohol dehydrogenase family)
MFNFGNNASEPAGVAVRFLVRKRALPFQCIYSETAALAVCGRRLVCNIGGYRRMRLQGKVAVVTGGGSGIGAATCVRMAREGATVAVLDRNAGAIESVAAGLQSCAIAVDVSNEDSVRAAFDRIAAGFGRIDVLVNNAGIAIRSPVDEATDHDWTNVMDVNVRGAFLCSRYSIPLMPPGASIIHMSSVTGITGVRNRAAYSAAKGALIALTRNMAVDYASRRIRVNCICPGFVRTPLTAALTEDKIRCERLTALHPLGRLGEPDDIAAGVVFLVSDEAAWITGHALVIDGGFSAGHSTDI